SYRPSYTIWSLLSEAIPAHGKKFIQNKHLRLHNHGQQLVNTDTAEAAGVQPGDTLNLAAPGTPPKPGGATATAATATGAPAHRHRRMPLVRRPGAALALRARPGPQRVPAVRGHRHRRLPREGRYPRRPRLPAVPGLHRAGAGHPRRGTRRLRGVPDLPLGHV